MSTREVHIHILYHILIVAVATGSVGHFWIIMVPRVILYMISAVVSTELVGLVTVSLVAGMHMSLVWEHLSLGYRTKALCFGRGDAIRGRGHSIATQGRGGSHAFFHLGLIHVGSHVVFGVIDRGP